MQHSAQSASEFLRILAHDGRLMVLCRLCEGPSSVGALSEALGLRQSTLSQHLAILRREGLVQTKRDGQTIYYSLGDARTREVIALLYRLFCQADREDQTAKRAPVGEA
ncbi:transcriptional regulator [Iodidimonas gelatinilytica]|uniref:Transcriptional regulator n=1 Tax=Iodidimonas gelatinilytica TaxID=1236966 RepID=A0A5A7MQW1_9PROT|nr:metalloregulator ArsR/SmtB family transcription factor [Iodidimonas gelatinilytica]GEQ97345.1 transcriptional regulator [Iodidimonas gelatinilytica]GEQ99669.1 transcriptional regulator [Iodidimonas gelatinilytica]